jgi:ribosomal protein L3 glutamine methyltransferase
VLPTDDDFAELATIRDWLRYAVSRFNAADLTYGHGTTAAVDDAAFLILHTLHLPIDDLAPWLDARLTRSEKDAIAGLVEARVTTRKPISYLTGTAYIRGHRFFVDERTIIPRSFIGELLCDHIDGAQLGDADGGLPVLVFGAEVAPTRILDLCTGGASLAILAARAFPEATIDAADISTDALAVAGRNVETHGLADRVHLIHSDLFAGLAGERYDLILSNPPYVTDAAVDAFPPEYAAEPRLAHAGGADGLDLVRRILDGADAHLTRDGLLVMEVGTGRAALEAAFPGMPFLWLDTAESQAEVFSIAASALHKKPRRKSR